MFRTESTCILWKNDDGRISRMIKEPVYYKVLRLIYNIFHPDQKRSAIDDVDLVYLMDEDASIIKEVIPCYTAESKKHLRYFKAAREEKLMREGKIAIDMSWLYEDSI